MKDIKQIIKGIDKLNPIPQVANKVMALAEDPDSSMSQISEIISYDQALTANVLKACNSAYFGLPKKVDSVHQAIVYLGMDQVVDLVLLGSGASNFKTKQEGYDLDPGELWKYSVASAILARELAEKKGSEKTHMIFTASLLKDIGKVVLNQYVADSFEKIQFLVSKHGFTFREAEKAVIGIDHAELGGMVAKKWEFPSQMVTLIENHHLHEEPGRGDFENCIIYLADTLCMMMGIGVGSDGLAYRFHKEALDFLGLTQVDVQEIIAGFGEKLSQVEDLISIH
jgi:putative nucleotidyltransferase with HDIG domain